MGSQLEAVLMAASAASYALRVLADVVREHPEVEYPADLPSRLARVGARASSVVLRIRLEPVRRKALRKPLSALARKPNVRSAWDPDVSPLSVEDVLETDRELDASSCQHLLMEIIRRAAYDWVLYRMSSKLQDRKKAEDAYQWLFVEKPGTKLWQERIRNDKQLTSLYSICEILDIAPGFVRKHVRRLTVKDVMSVGRPSERRHPSVEDVDREDYVVHLNRSSMEILTSPDRLFVRANDKLKRG